MINSQTKESKMSNKSIITKEGKMEVGQIVQHKLTGEHLLILDDNGMGASQTPKTRVRTQCLNELILDTAELEPLDEWVLEPR